MSVTPNMQEYIKHIDKKFDRVVNSGEQDNIIVNVDKKFCDEPHLTILIQKLEEYYQIWVPNRKGDGDVRLLLM